MRRWRIDFTSSPAGDLGYSIFRKKGHRLYSGPTSYPGENNTIIEPDSVDYVFAPDGADEMFFGGNSTSYSRIHGNLTRHPRLGLNKKSNQRLNLTRKYGVIDAYTECSIATFDWCGSYSGTRTNYSRVRVYFGFDEFGRAFNGDMISGGLAIGSGAAYCAATKSHPDYMRIINHKPLSCEINLITKNAKAVIHMEPETGYMHDVEYYDKQRDGTYVRRSR